MADRCDVPCFKEDLVSRLKDEMPSDEALQSLADLFGLLADPTRLRIIGALASARTEICVCDVAHVVGLSLSATSHQLRKLRTAGAVTARNDGRMVYYRLRDRRLAQLVRKARAHIQEEAAA